MDPNIERFSGFADKYDTIRPHLPSVALDLLCEAAGTTHPTLVVDLGSGTGLSSRIWIGRAARIIGIEPNPDMRWQAQSILTTPAVEYVEGRGEATGLPPGGADIVTVGQALHWMNPPGVFKEATRLLRRDGVFAAYDCDWPPFVHWRLSEAWQRLRNQSEQIIIEEHLAPGLTRAQKSDYLGMMRASQRFQSVFEQCFHVRVAGDVPRLRTLLESQGGIATALKVRNREILAGLDEFESLARTVVGNDMVPWTYSYRMRVGIA